MAGLKYQNQLYPSLSHLVPTERNNRLRHHVVVVVIAASALEARSSPESPMLVDAR
jgi:hypothetical protein